MRQTEVFTRLDRDAYYSECADNTRFGRVGRSLVLFAYAGAGWGIVVLALFSLADIL